ncbi:MAG: hypothetical protein JXB04_13005 [Kiritimatiellae bacterium]|nr:hypothetical protein [Kiritimatiellia bacterium]
MNSRMHRSVTATVTAVLLLIGQAVTAQTLPEAYFTDSMQEYDGYSSLYRLDMSTGVPVLELMPNGLLPYNNTDAIACEPDGSIIWLIDDMYGVTGAGTVTDTGLLLAYYVADGSIAEIGELKRLSPFSGVLERLKYVDQATCAPDGTLYIGHNNTDTILTVDKSTAVATTVGKVVTTNFNPAGVSVNIGGGDLTFDANGVFYLYIYEPKDGAPRGYYALRLPAEDGIVYAEYVGNTATRERISGTAVLEQGLGNLIASVTQGGHPNYFIEVDRANGAMLASHPMLYNGQQLIHQWGDMTTGPLWHEETNDVCTYTIGYWKNHTWNGRVVTILGVKVDEILGKKILKAAKNTNVSMFFAQLIAAKLNVNNSSRAQPMADAEKWLDEWDAEFCPVVVPDGNGGLTLDWKRRFCCDEEKMLMTYWKDLLDAFNNSNHCEEPADPVVKVSSSTGKGKNKKK